MAEFVDYYKDAYNQGWQQLGFNPIMESDDLRNFAYNVASMQYQNQYNSPSSQMARYTDAGLNPNLVYSQQQQASASPGSPNFSSQTKRMQRFQNMISMVSSFAGVAGQVMNFAKGLQDLFQTKQENQFIKQFNPHEVIQEGEFGSDGKLKYIDYSNGIVYFPDDKPEDYLPSYISLGQGYYADPTLSSNPYAQKYIMNFQNLLRSNLVQKWYNNLSEGKLDLLKGQKELLSTQGSILNYNKEMLETLPPWGRQLYMMMSMMLNMLMRAF